MMNLIRRQGPFPFLSLMVVCPFQSRSLVCNWAIQFWSHNAWIPPTSPQILPGSHHAAFISNSPICAKGPETVVLV